MENSTKRMISAVIMTFNEEKRIGNCIRSIIDVVDEIVVVDSFSSDKTQEICKNYDVVFLQNRFEGYIQQRKFAIGHVLCTKKGFVPRNRKSVLFAT